MTTPLRERRYHDALKAIERTKARREAAVRTLVKCESLLPKLERKARRLGAPVKAKATQPKPAPTLPTIEPIVEADGIPDFLRRSRAAEVQAEVDAEKKRKADLAAEKRAVKKEHVEAELTGKRRKMPLAGKDALAAIRDGG